MPWKRTILKLSAVRGWKVVHEKGRGVGVGWGRRRRSMGITWRKPWYQFSSLPLASGSSWGHEGWFSRDPLSVSSAGGRCEQFWHGQSCPLFDVVHPAFPLPTTASPTLQDALKYGFGEAVVACDMPEPHRFPFLDRCQKRFTWTH